MSRRSTFEADAESVQGNAGATVTFRAITIGQAREYRETSMTDDDLLRAHVLDWSGIVDDDDHALPSPKDEPGVLDALYIFERTAIARLLFTGAPVIPAKN